MSMIKAALLATLIPVTLAAPLAAQEAGSSPTRPAFSELDTNGDGALTLEELQAIGSNRFAQADADGDGVLTRDELIARAAERHADRIDRLIERADSDGDGQLTMAELEEAREGRTRGRGRNPERMFERIDTDGDGAISEAEFEEAMERMRDRGRHGGRHGNHRDR